MNTQGINKKRVVAFMLSLLLVMQQSLAYQVMAASIITNGNGGTITPDANGVYNLYPDSYKGNVGYRVFKDFNSLPIDFVEWEEEDMAKALCIQVFYLEKT